jgi:putative ABC transport system permease protein
MNLFLLTARNLRGSPLRSTMVLLAIALVAGFAVGVTLVIQGARQQLRTSLTSTGRPEVDITVALRAGGSAMGMGGPAAPAGGPKEILAVPGVEAVSPELHLATFNDTPFCPGRDLLLIAFDPGTDFSVLRLLPAGAPRVLQAGEAFAGSDVSAGPGAESLALFGYELRITAHLAPTGTSLDESLFVTFETKSRMVKLAQYRYGAGIDAELAVAMGNSPVTLVRVEPGREPHEVATRILERVPGVVPFVNEGFLGQGRTRMTNLLRSLPWLLGAAWILSTVFIGLVFSVAVTQRRREIGVLRALGATRAFVVRSILAEGLALAVAGAGLGVVLAALPAVLFRGTLASFLGVPLSSPSPPWLFALCLAAMVLSLASVTLATLLPALRISRRDPTLTMKA